MYKVTIHNDKSQLHVKAKEVILIALDEDNTVYSVMDCGDELRLTALHELDEDGILDDEDDFDVSEDEDT